MGFKFPLPVHFLDAAIVKVYSELCGVKGIKRITELGSEGLFSVENIVLLCYRVALGRVLVNTVLHRMGADPRLAFHTSRNPRAGLTTSNKCVWSA